MYGGQNRGVRFLSETMPAHELTYNDVFMVPNRSAAQPQKK